MAKAKSGALNKGIIWVGVLTKDEAFMETNSGAGSWLRLKPSLGPNAVRVILRLEALTTNIFEGQVLTESKVKSE